MELMRSLAIFPLQLRSVVMQQENIVTLRTSFYFSSLLTMSIRGERENMQNTKFIRFSCLNIHWDFFFSVKDRGKNNDITIWEVRKEMWLEAASSVDRVLRVKRKMHPTRFADDSIMRILVCVCMPFILIKSFHCIQHAMMDWWWFPSPHVRVHSALAKTSETRLHLNLKGIMIMILLLFPSLLCLFSGNKYLQKSSVSRICAVGGFFISIPIFLTGKCTKLLCNSAEQCRIILIRMSIPQVLFYTHSHSSIRRQQ